MCWDCGYIANGAIFDSDFFSEYVEPYEKPVIDAIHSHGAFTIYHNCGMAKGLYSSYKRMGFSLWETVSGGCRENPENNGSRKRGRAV